MNKLEGLPDNPHKTELEQDIKVDNKDATQLILAIECRCDPKYRHICWKCGGTGYLKQ